MLKREFRTFTRKENRIQYTSNSKQIKRGHSNHQNLPQYQKLTFSQMQRITRTIMKDPKAHELNIGVISSIKGKMYCLKLGQVSSSKNFSNYFYTNLYRRRLLKPQPLKKLNQNQNLFCSVNSNQRL